MTDIVNEYFHRFYPSGLEDEDFDFDSMLGERRYKRAYKTTIFPRIKCADGFSMSVQGHYGAYCAPRGDFEGHYSSVEVGYPSKREDLLMPYVEDADRPTDTVYGYVPVEVVAAVIEKHGGMAKEKTS